MVPRDGLDHIRRTSRRFRLLFQFLIVVIPGVNVLFWALFNHLPAGFLQGLPVSPAMPLPLPVLAAGFVASLLPLGVIIFGLVTMRRLFGLYEAGEIFSGENVRCFRHMGYTFIAWVLANTVYTPLLSVIITAVNPPGQKSLVLQFGSPQMSALIAGGIVLLIAWVMEEGRKLEDEQAHTV